MRKLQNCYFKDNMLEVPQPQQRAPVSGWNNDKKTHTQNYLLTITLHGEIQWNPPKIEQYIYIYPYS